MKRIFKFSILLSIFCLNSAYAINPCNCKGYDGVGGPAYEGVGAQNIVVSEVLAMQALVARVIQEWAVEMIVQASVDKMVYQVPST